MEHKIYSPPYRPQSNGRIEGFHAFLKTCLAKHVSPSVEWDEVCTLATAAYNFLPNEHSRESPYFIMFGRDPRLPLAELFQHKLRYLGADETVLSLQALRNMYLIIAENLRKCVCVIKGTLSLRVRRLRNHLLLLLRWAHRFTGNSALGRLALPSFLYLHFRRSSHNGRGGPGAHGAGG